MKRRQRSWLALFLAALAASGALAGGAVERALRVPYRGYSGESARLEIAPGTGAAAILEQLERQGIVSSALLARAYLVYAMGSPPLHAGEYRFAEPRTLPEVLDVLARGRVLMREVTVIEGLTLEETARALADQGFGAVEALEREMRQPGRIADLDPAATDLEGYLYPDTYSFARGTPEADVVSALVETFRRRWLRDVVPLLAADAPAAARSLVTLASIVEKEARIDAERPVIAGVYANRLRRGIALYADPTVIFALKRLGRWDGNLRRPDLELDSPYNTYRYPGLPPGPICSPGVASLRAAAAPDAVPYLYFVSRNDGSHVFAETLGEHNRNVERWQRQYWRERWRREREAGTVD